MVAHDLIGRLMIQCAVRSFLPWSCSHWSGFAALRLSLRGVASPFGADRSVSLVSFLPSQPRFCCATGPLHIRAPHATPPCKSSVAQFADSPSSPPPLSSQRQPGLALILDQLLGFDGSEFYISGALRFAYAASALAVFACLGMPCVVAVPRLAGCALWCPSTT